jgi:hypothetical protein
MFLYFISSHIYKHVWEVWLVHPDWAKLQAPRYIAITKMNQIAGKREYPIYPYDWTFDFFLFFLGIHWTFEFGLTDFTTKDIFRWKQRQTESPRPWPVGSWGSRLTRQPPNFIMCNKYLNCTVYCETCTIWNNGMIEMQTQTPIKIMYLWSTSRAMFSIMCALKIIKFTSFDKK